MTNDRLQHIPWFAVSFQGGFWDERQATNRDRTIPAIYYQTRITGRIDGWKYQPELEQNIRWKPFTLKAIPYCFWANRQPGEMQVWLLKAP